MFCIECGERLPENARFCPRDGQPAATPQPERVAALAVPFAPVANGLDISTSQHPPVSEPSGPISGGDSSWSCSSCQWINPGHDLTCPHCGKARTVVTDLWECRFCAKENAPDSRCCVRCQTSRLGTEKAAIQTIDGHPASQSPGEGFSTAGIILGVLALLFFPIILGPAGLVLGAVGQSKGEKKAVIAMAVAGCGTLIGMFIGAMTASVWGL